MKPVSTLFLPWLPTCDLSWSPMFRSLKIERILTWSNLLMSLQSNSGLVRSIQTCGQFDSLRWSSYSQEIWCVADGADGRYGPNERYDLRRPGQRRGSRGGAGSHHGRSTAEIVEKVGWVLDSFLKQVSLSGSHVRLNEIFCRFAVDIFNVDGKQRRKRRSGKKSPVRISIRVFVVMHPGRMCFDLSLWS